MEDGSHAVGLFNRSKNEINITAFWKDLGISEKQKVRDLWRQKDIGGFKDKYTSDVPAHGVVMVRMWPSAEK
jgi:alpha-galactosidase